MLGSIKIARIFPNFRPHLRILLFETGGSASRFTGMYKRGSRKRIVESWCRKIEEPKGDEKAKRANRAPGTAWKWSETDKPEVDRCPFSTEDIFNIRSSYPAALDTHTHTHSSRVYRRGEEEREKTCLCKRNHLVLKLHGNLSEIVTRMHPCTPSKFEFR